MRKLAAKIAWWLMPAAASWIRARKGSKLDAKLGRLSPRQAFAEVYQKGLWGVRDGGLGSSGGGSHDSENVDPYVTAITEFVERLSGPITLVDLGCGDLAVGRRLIPLVDHYVGCDVVPDLIVEHRRNYARPDASFECIDIVRDELPRGEVATIRQVFQHLSNEQIRAVLPKLNCYQHVIVTEHVPQGTFLPNADKHMGPGTRLANASGVVLGIEPFELCGFTTTHLCSVEADGGVIATRLHTQVS